MIFDGHRQGLFLAHQHHQLLAAGEAGVDEIALQHGVVLGEQRNHHGGIFAALAFVDRAGIGRHQVIELTPAVDHGPAASDAGLVAGEQHA